VKLHNSFVPSTPFTQVPNDQKCCADELSFPDSGIFHQPPKAEELPTTTDDEYIFLAAPYWRNAMQTNTLWVQKEGP